MTAKGCKHTLFLLHVRVDERNGMSFWILYVGAPAGLLLLFLAAIIAVGLWLKAYFSRKSKAEFRVALLFPGHTTSQTSHRESPKHHRRTSHQL